MDKDGFFLHGGYYMGSIGCIDVGIEIVELLEALNSVGKLGPRYRKIMLIADYRGGGQILPKTTTGSSVPWPSGKGIFKGVVVSGGGP